MKAIGTILFAFPLSACNVVGVCDGIALHAVEVLVVSQETGEPLGSGPGWIIATDGAFADSIRIPPGQTPSGTVGAGLAEERPGTYKVEVLMEGFAPWVREGVRAEADECHVKTVEITARLESAAT